MKKYPIILVLVACCCVSFSCAQTCEGNGQYLKQVFPQINKTADIRYATAPALTPVYAGESVTYEQDLYLDFFEPAGDTLSKRPLVMIAFGGAFMVGSKNDADIQSVCDSLAHRGFAVASIQYRLGMNSTDAVSAERAVYRATQDYSAAVRYFKNFASQYRIDTSAIFVGGASAGSFAAIHMAYGEENERPASSYGTSGLFGIPDLGCFDCSGNSYPFSHRVRGVLNNWGAIGFLDWIEAGGPPIVSVHATGDPIVPFSEGHPFNLPVMPYVYGSQKITERMQQLNIYHEFYPFNVNEHQLWGMAQGNLWVGSTGPTEHQLPIINIMCRFIYNQLKPQTSELSGTKAVCAGEQVWYSVPPETNTSYCWQIQNGTILQISNNQILVQWNNAGQGEVSARAFNHFNIPADSFSTVSVQVYEYPAPPPITQNDSILSVPAATGATYQWYLNGQVIEGATRDTLKITQSGAYTCSVWNEIGCSAVSASYYAVIKNDGDSSGIDQRDNAVLSVYPNPFAEAIHISGLPSGEHYVRMLSMIGQEIKQFSVNSNKTVINTENLASGVYILIIRNNNGSEYKFRLCK